MLASAHHTSRDLQPHLQDERLSGQPGTRPWASGTVAARPAYRRLAPAEEQSEKLFGLESVWFQAFLLIMVVAREAKVGWRLHRCRLSLSSIHQRWWPAGVSGPVLRFGSLTPPFASEAPRASQPSSHSPTPMQGVFTFEDQFGSLRRSRSLRLAARLRLHGGRLPVQA